MKTAATAVTVLPARTAKRTPAKHGNTSHQIKALATAGRDLFDNCGYESSEEADK